MANREWKISIRHSPFAHAAAAATMTTMLAGGAIAASS
jgi:hypothetical protein